MTAVGRQPIETLRERLRSNGKRITALERRPTHPVAPAAISMIAVGSATEIPPDTTSAVYVVADDTVVHEGVTRTLAEWQAIHGP